MDQPTAEESAAAESADTAAPEKHRGRHRARRAIVVVVAVVLLLLVGTGAAYVGFINHTLTTKVKHEALLPPPKAGVPVPARDPAAGKALNVLLIGSDSRGDVSDGRSDAIMLIHLSSDRKRAHLVHFPRDLYVDVPGHGKDKINAAYRYGGAPLLVRTLQDLVDVPIDNVAVIGFEGFKAMTDALGGVNVFAEEASNERGVVRVGMNHLDGEAALGFVSERLQLSEGDISRGRRQQAFIKALMVQALSKETLTNPVRFAEFAGAGARHLTVDNAFTVSDMRSQALELRDLRSKDIVFITAPISGFGTSPQGASIDLVDEARMAKLSAAVRSDKMSAISPGKQIP
jgi:polyisoprenyl-teichoic acid--peptidoglycan teichoic acid transferase